MYCTKKLEGQAAGSPTVKVAVKDIVIGQNSNVVTKKTIAHFSDGKYIILTNSRKIRGLINDGTTELQLTLLSTYALRKSRISGNV